MNGNENRLSLQPEIDALLPGATPELLGGYDPSQPVTDHELCDFRRGLANINHPEEVIPTRAFEIGALVATLRAEQGKGEQK